MSRRRWHGCASIIDIDSAQLRCNALAIPKRHNPIYPLKLLIKLSRPRFWFYTAGPFLLGYMAGLSAPRELRTPAFWLPFLYFLVPANVFLYGINDLFDADTDALSVKKGAQEHRLATPEHRLVIGLLIGVGILDLIFASVLVSKTEFYGLALFALFIVLSALYSAPPVRFKARAFLDSYSNALYVLPGLLGYVLTAHQFPPILIVLAAIAWAAGMHAYSAIPDIQPDQAAGIRTAAVALGEKRALLFVLANWSAAALLAIGSLGAIGLPALVYPLIALVLYQSARWSVAAVYWWFPYLNALIGFLAFVYLAAAS